MVGHPGASTSVAVLGLRRGRGHGRGRRSRRSWDWGLFGVLMASCVRRRRWRFHVDHFRFSIAELVRVGWSGSSHRWCVGLLVQLLSERSGGGCALKPAFLDRCRGWRRSALLTYKMNIFGKIFNCRSDVAVAVLSLMSRCRSRLPSFFSRRLPRRRRRRLGPETFAQRFFQRCPSVRRSNPPDQECFARKYTLNQKHTDHYDLSCVLSLFTGS